MQGLMQGKRGLIMGVANGHSIAWGIAKALASQGRRARLHLPGRRPQEAGGAARGHPRLGAPGPRFPAPVPVDGKVRARAEVVTVDEVGGGWWQVVTRFTLEVEGNEKPCFVGDSVTRVMAPAE